MLKELHISNYALIEKAQIEFGNGMSVITGETGAGKSILLGALSLLQGQRADLQVLFDKEKKCVVEAVFDVSNYGLQSLFDENDADYDDQTIIRREILPNGKSRAFVNDTAVNLTFLKALSNRLIDIHSQHQNLLLSDVNFHLLVTDAVAATQEVSADYLVTYKEYKSLVANEKDLVERNAKMKQDFEYIEFQHKQLAEAKLKEGEDEELEQERERLLHSEEIKTELSFAVDALEGDNSVLSTLLTMGNKLTKIEQFLPADSSIIARIESARIDLDDILKTLKNQNEDVDFDPERQTFVEQRLDLIFSLEQKHRVQTVAELLAIQQDLAGKLHDISSFDEEIEELRKQIAEKRDVLKSKADKLSKMRTTVFAKIEEYVCNQLKDMGMQNARFVVSRTETDFSPTGIDEIKFLFAANKSGEPTEISRVASGGEMSRVMLSIKSLLSKTKGLPSIIFDEIDTGVSGEVADRMGKIMNEMAENMQVIAITHLPQVAAKGQCHYRVYKTDEADRTVSNIVRLSDDERVEELAKMLSGSTVSTAALQNARELLGL